MKAIIIGLLVLSSFSAMARETLRETLNRVQLEQNVQCVLENAGFDFCIGNDPTYKVCRSTRTYACSGEENFVLKLKVKTSYNESTGARETVVVKQTIR